ncbi:hypothetical protein [Streptomyces galbus]|uniref:Uncharacterized protein n=1 Tax=Streptomyces galbus TaxID=33898 RepID=A0ABX1IGJ1_STRGB|nr:hypothetical protein [Streptomyces galbus]NKQ24781.1 hypothetical protein [Streptomyces galbus]
MLLPHDDELPQDEELLPHDDEPPPHDELLPQDDGAEPHEEWCEESCPWCPWWDEWEGEPCPDVSATYQDVPRNAPVSPSALRAGRASSRPAARPCAPAT